MAQAVIAVVDDDAAFLTMMQDLLADEDYQVLLCSDGEDAYSLIQRERPDLVILDIRMDLRDVGLKILQLMRLNPITQQVPVIVCSADGRLLDEQREDLCERCCDVVQKPFDIDELLLKISQMVGQAPV